MGKSEKGGLEQQLVACRGDVLRFLRQRVGDRELAEDLTQETLLRALCNLSCLRRPEALLAWVQRIAQNIAMDWHRRGRFREPVPNDGEGLVEPMADQAPPDAEHGFRQERQFWSQRLRRGLAMLRESERAMLVSHYFEGRSCREISAREDLSQANVRVRLYRARRLLRDLLPDEEEYGAHQAALSQYQGSPDGLPRARTPSVRTPRRCRP